MEEEEDVVSSTLFCKLNFKFDFLSKSIHSFVSNVHLMPHKCIHTYIGR